MPGCPSGSGFRSRAYARFRAWIRPYARVFGRNPVLLPGLTPGLRCETGRMPGRDGLKEGGSGEDGGGWKWMTGSEVDDGVARGVKVYREGMPGVALKGGMAEEENGPGAAECRGGPFPMDRIYRGIWF